MCIYIRIYIYIYIERERERERENKASVTREIKLIHVTMKMTIKNINAYLHKIKPVKILGHGWRQAATDAP